MKTEVFYEYIENILHPYLVKVKTKFPVIMFLDGHKTHLSYELSTLCRKLNIILIALYPNATRILQPADVSCFKPLKMAWKMQVLKWRRENPYCQITKDNFAPILKEAIGSLKAEVISNGFRACGLYPWNVEAIDFSKCLGKNRVLGDKFKTISSYDKITFEEFADAVGEQKLQELYACSDYINNVENKSDDFNALLRVYNKFFMASTNQNKIIDDIPNQLENITLNNNTIDEEEVIMELVPDDNIIPSVSKEDIMNMPILIVSDTSNVKNEDGNLKNYLPIQKTPERTGKKNSVRLPYVITSTEFKIVQEEKITKRIKKEEDKKKREEVKEEKRKLLEEKKKLLQEKKKLKLTEKNKKTASKKQDKIKILSNELISDDEKKAKHLSYIRKLFDSPEKLNI